MKILKQKRGISTIIAVLLMIVISVAAAVITYIWVMGYLGGTMSGIKQSTTQMQTSIDTAYNNTAGTTVSVVVRNTGSITAVVDKIYIGTSASNLADAGTVNGNKNIAVSSTQLLNVTYSVTKGTTYIVKVVTTDGQSATAPFTA
jgi:FlaG/FlaF family flagellin (archaellin)